MNIYIEVLVRWTEFQMQKQDAQDAYIKHLVEGEPVTPEMKVKFEYSPMVFNMKDVCRFNRANDDSHTTLRFYDGESYVVKCQYEKFLALYSDMLNAVITTIKEDDEINKVTRIDDLGLD